MRWVRFSIILLIVTLLDTGNLLNTLSVSSLNIRPDLLIILLVFFAINCDPAEAITASFVIGFAADISSTVMGPCIIVYGLFGGMISHIRKVVIMKRMLHRAGAIFITTLLAGGLIQILTAFKTKEAALNLHAVLLGTAVYSGLAGPLLWWIFSGISGWLGLRKPRLGRLSNR